MHPNGARLIEAMADFTGGNYEALTDLFAEDAEWIFGGRSRFAGTYRGRDTILAWLRDIKAEAAAEIRPLGVLASDRHVVVFNELIAGRGAGRSRTTEAFCCVMNDKGQIQTFFQLNADQDAFDASVEGSVPVVAR
jgi:ketosteroid isomerase-like protein